MKKFLILPAFVMAAALVGCEPAEPAAPVVPPPTTEPVVVGEVEPVEGDVDVEVVPAEEVPPVVETPAP